MELKYLSTITFFLQVSIYYVQKITEIQKAESLANYRC